MLKMTKAINTDLIAIGEENGCVLCALSYLGLPLETIIETLEENVQVIVLSLINT